MEQNSTQIPPIKTIHDIARRNKILVEYQLEKESGPAHAKIYTIRLYFGDKQYVGVDRSIKLAQRAAAQIALEEYNQHDSPINNNQNQKLTIHQPPTVILNTWATQHHISTQYVLLNEQYIPSAMNRSHTLFTYRLYLGNNFYFDGHGSSHQQARIDCASHALHFIQQNPMFDILSTSPKQNQSKSQISLMYERAKQLGLSVKIEHNDPLTVTYSISEEYRTTATGQTKHSAKQLAAEKMLEILPIAEDKLKTKHNRKRSNQHKKFIEQKGSTEYSLSEDINPITRLYQIAGAREKKIEFIQLDDCQNEKLFHFHVKFDENDYADGYDKNKQAAKRKAAENLLLKMNMDLFKSVDISLPPPPKKGLLKRQENSHKQNNNRKHVHFIEDQSINPKEQLNSACQKFNIHIEYDDQLLDEQYETILSLSKDNQLLAKFRGNAMELTNAQDNAASAAWKNFEDLFNELNIQKC